MEYLEDILTPIAVFTMIVLIVWINRRQSESRLKAQAETRKHLLDKFGSGPELAAFLESPGGKRFLLSEQRDPRKRILQTIAPGMILTAMGLGMIGLSVEEGGLIIPGVIILSIGVGFLVAAGVSYYLSKKWGLFRDEA